jgi:hypothetical protein
MKPMSDYKIVEPQMGAPSPCSATATVPIVTASPGHSNRYRTPNGEQDGVQDHDKDAEAFH